MIFVFGCDGYIGNALVQKLLSEGKEVIGFDNFWRRDWVRDEMCSFSATPIMDMEEKTQLFNEIYSGTFSFEELDILYNLITTSAAQAIGIKRFELKEGNRANLVVLDVRDIWEAIWHHEEPQYVIKDGCVVKH